MNLTSAEITKVKQVMGEIPYVFQRAEGFYPLMLQSDDEAETNGVCNPGTICVTNELTGKVVFRSV